MRREVILSLFPKVPPRRDVSIVHGLRYRGDGALTVGSLVVVMRITMLGTAYVELTIKSR